MNAIIFNESGNELIRRTMGGYKIADMMREDGWTIEVLDWTASWTNEEVKEFIESLPYKIDLFAFSNLWMQDLMVCDKIAFLKEHYPDIKILMGGPKPYQMDYGADAMVFGYSEYALNPVFDWLVGDSLLHPEGKYPEWAPNSYLVDANNSYKALNNVKFDVKYHENDFIVPGEALTLELSRGCKFRCKYCNYAFLGVKEFSDRTVDDVYDELMFNYETWGTTNYIISDDTFNDRNSKIETLAIAVERLPFEANFSCFIRLDLVIANPEQVELLCRARVWMHFYGIETLHPKAARAIGKGMHPDKIKAGLLWIRKEFYDRIGVYRGTCGMIAGLPHEPVEHWYEALKWLDENWESYFYWGLHISKDTDNTTQSDFSLDSEKFGYYEATDPEVLAWGEKEFEKRFVEPGIGRQNNKLDNRNMLWQTEHSNFMQATEFANMYLKNYFSKQKIFGFDLTEHLSKFAIKPLLKFTVKKLYLKKNINSLYLQRIAEYKAKKLGIYK
jgi:hypothetical protein